MLPDPKFLSVLIPDLDFLILQSLAIIITAVLLKKMTITSFLGPITTAVALSWVNSVYWDSKLFFEIPSNISVDALGLIISNSLILWLIVKLAPGIEIQGFFTAIKASLLLSISSYLVHRFCSNLNWVEIFHTFINLLGNLKSYFLSSAHAK